MASTGLSPATIIDPSQRTAAVNTARPSAAATATPAASQNAVKKLADDFDSFLTLLTAQLQNQDPLAPMDSSDFTNQLVQFSSVEQEIQSNKNLETLISLMGGNSASTALGYIGHSVKTTNSSTTLRDGIAAWNYQVDPGAATTVLTVKDEKGNAVFTKEGKITKGEHGFVWDGKNKNGDPLPEGVYSLSVTALSADKKPVNTKLFSNGIVTGVETTGTEPTLMIGGVKISIKDVLSVAAPKTPAELAAEAALAEANAAKKAAAAEARLNPTN